MEEFWLKYGFKENGELVCVRTLSNGEPDKKFFYTDNGANKEMQNSDVIKLTKDNIKKMNNL